MKHYPWIFGLFLLVLASCGQQERAAVSNTANQLTLLEDEFRAWEYEGLRLYPIVADAALVQAREHLKNIKTLSPGMDIPGFRITERRQFGRTLEPEVSTLTVQNRGEDTIYIMAGDVVTGGNQDRVVAQDYVIAANSLRNIEVFCVERGRWRQNDTTATGGGKEAIVFGGYFHVAAPAVRRAVQRGEGQEAVWSAVAQVTGDNAAASATQTYAALERANDYARRRDAMTAYFQDAWQNLPNVVGVIAVRNGEILGADVFGHPALFAGKFPSLLQGYAAEPGASAEAQAVSREMVQHVFQEMAAAAQPGKSPDKAIGKSEAFGSWLHIYRK